MDHDHHSKSCTELSALRPHHCLRLYRASSCHLRLRIRVQMQCGLYLLSYISISQRMENETKPGLKGFCISMSWTHFTIDNGEVEISTKIQKHHLPIELSMRNETISCPFR